MAHIRTFQAGQHSACSQQILNEIAAAKLVLLDPQTKSDYDATVVTNNVAQLAVADAPAVPPPALVSPPVNQPQEPSPETSQPFASTQPNPTSAHRTNRQRRNTSSWILKVVGGGVCGIAIAIVIALLALGNNPFKQSANRPTQSAHGSPDTKPKSSTNPDLATNPRESRTGNERTESEKNSDEQTNAKTQRGTDPSDEPPAPGDDKDVPVDIATTPDSPSKSDEVSSPGTKKLAQPLEAALAKARKRVTSALEGELSAAKTATQKAVVANKLLRLGHDTVNEPDARYALFDLAREIAVEAHDVAAAFQAVDALDETYQMDALAAKTQALESMGAATDQVEHHEKISKTSHRLVTDAIKQDELPTALRLADQALESAKRSRNGFRVKEIESRLEEWKGIHDEWKEAIPFRERLRENADDAEACLKVGRYLCLVKNSWAEGLPLLSKGANEQVQQAAKSEMADPKEPQDQVNVGNAWFDLSSEVPNKRDRENLLLRAYFWYELALPRLTGLARVEVNNRLEQIHQDRLKHDPLGIIRAFEGHTSSVLGVAFSPNGRLAASTGYKSDPTLRIWSVETGRQLAVLEIPDGWAHSVAFTPDGEHLVTGSGQQGTIHEWDVQSGKRQRTFTGHKGTIRRIVFSPDGTLMLSACYNDWSARLWDFKTGKTKQTFAQRACWGCSFGPDGKTVLIGGGVGSTLWKIDGSKIRTLTAAKDEKIKSAVISSDGQHAITSGKGGIRYWDLVKGRMIRTLASTENRLDVSFLSPRTIVSTGPEGAVQLWGLTRGDEVFRFDDVGRLHLALSPDKDKRRALSHNKGTVFLLGLPK